MGIRRIMPSFENLSIRQKVLYSTVIMFFLIGILSSLAYWLIFIPNLVDKIHQHGLRVAYSLVTRTRSYILSDNRPELTFRLFQKKMIEKDLSYIFITDSRNRILAHTFIGSIPSGIQTANMLGKNEDEKIKLIKVNSESIYDGAVSIKTGIKLIGVIHIGIGKKPVDALTKEMGLVLIMVTAFIILLATLLSNLVANYISRPLSTLVRAMNDLCMGEIKELPPASQPTKCWELLRCDKKQCPVHEKEDLICWFIDGTLCHGHTPPKTLEKCYNCDVYKKQSGNEIVQLSSAFTEFIHTLQLKTKEIRTSEEKYRLLFNYDPNPLFVIEMNKGMILDVNNPALEIYQYKREELARISILDLFHEEDAALFWKVVRNPVKEYFFLPKIRAKTRTLNTFFVNVYARIAKLQDMDLPFLIVSTVDITQRLEQEAQLIQAGKMATLGEMATGIAHELNQPLNVIKVGADYFRKMIMRGEKIPEEDLSKVSRNMSEQVDRATNIINHLRDFGRKAEVTQYLVDINEPIREVFNLIGQQLKLRDIEVHLDLDEKLPKIMADKNRLEQIFLNLATNAKDAMEEKGSEALKKLTITTNRERENVVIVVSDTGVGMPKEIKERVFEPFFTTKEVGEGTGLGLSITYNLVKYFNGEIELESTPDVGTTFKLRFPVRNDEGTNDKQTFTN